MLDTNIDNTYSQVVSDPLVPRQEAAPDGVARRGQPPQASAALGNTTKSVDIGYTARRAGRFSLHNHVRRLLPNERVSHCMCACGSGGVEVLQSPSKIASYAGLQVCGSVWTCPICSTKIAEERRRELNRSLEWGRGQGYKPVLLTLTMRHSIGHTLYDSLKSLKTAKQRFHQSRAWRGVKRCLEGHITATEVTHGQNGWHPHFHMLLFLSTANEEEALLLVESARKAWQAALQNVGYGCNQHAYHVQGAASAGDYVGKWGPAEEMTLSNTKEAKRSGKGLSPWQLLAQSATGHKQSGALFIEYARVFKGSRQLVWSPGLKERIGIEEVEDLEVAAVPEAGPVELVTTIERSLWRKIVQHGLRAQVLEVLEDQGPAALNEYLDRLRKQFPQRDN